MASRSWGGAETLILCYHRIAEGVADPFGLCVSPDHFANQLRRLLKRTDPATLDDIEELSSRSRFVVTFDDGYADNLAVAAPIAASLGVPITIYVTSGMIGDTKGFWWDRLGTIVMNPEVKSPKTVDVDGSPIAFDVSNSKQRRQTLMRLHDALLGWRSRDIDSFVGRLAKELDVDDDAPADAMPMSEAELLSLKSMPVTIGAHTVDHTRMHGHTLDDQLQMVSDSKSALEAMVGSDVEHFAYPFGGPDAVDSNSVSACRKAGFATAATTDKGLLNSSPSPLELRRHIVMDWSPLRFELQLRYWGI